MVAGPGSWRNGADPETTQSMPCSVMSGIPPVTAHIIVEVLWALAVSRGPAGSIGVIPVMMARSAAP
jgi:hypothetical protein